MDRVFFWLLRSGLGLLSKSTSRTPYPDLPRRAAGAAILLLLDTDRWWLSDSAFRLGLSLSSPAFLRRALSSFQNGG